ncbi:MAG: GGDEF domain-containing protein [Pseudomonadota bacterium]
MNMTDMQFMLAELLEMRKVTSLFQPIVDMREGMVHGYEALSRGPSDSSLHSPLVLLRAADHFGMASKIERLCVETAAQGFVARKLTGKLFINVRPGRLFEPFFQPSALADFLGCVGLDPRRVVLEITESDPVFEYSALIQAVEGLRAVGIEIAMDDLGEGFSSLRLWSELKPSYVKIDKHFVAGLNQDPVKLQFVRSLQQIAEKSQSFIVAEGIEMASELAVVRDIGIAFGQGYLIGRPAAMPSSVPSSEAVQCLAQSAISVFPRGGAARLQPDARRLLIEAPCVDAGTPSERVLEILQEHEGLHAVAVVEDGIPVGMISRPFMLDRFTHLYSRELFGRKSCAMFMDDEPLVVDIGTLISELSELVVRKGKQAFSDGFVITENGRYRGLGSGFDLMREITDMQVVAARYSNPLTLLPGNVPIHEHTDRLLAAGVSFVAAYFDLDHFKPYNDVYGYRKGDEMIQLLGRLIAGQCDPNLDFVGHIGGDDFIVLFQSHDWEWRCREILDAFDASRWSLFLPEHIARGGYESEDRRGHMVFHPLVVLSIGAVPVHQDCFQQHLEVERAASLAKKMAKKTEGSSLFIERRCAGREPGRACDWLEEAEALHEAKALTD